MDDDKIVSYKWTQDKGPSIPLQAMNTPILTLDNMVAGTYVFRLVGARSAHCETLFNIPF